MATLRLWRGHFEDPAQSTAPHAPFGDETTPPLTQHGAEHGTAPQKYCRASLCEVLCVRSCRPTLLRGMAPPNHRAQAKWSVPEVQLRTTRRASRAADAHNCHEEAQ